MKKIALTLLFLGFFVLLPRHLPAYSQDFFREILKPFGLTEKEEDFSIFSDPNYSQPTHNFSPGQTVYIKVEAPGGEKGKTLRLLDAEKKGVLRLTLNQSGNVFTTSFSAPSASGVYYVDIKIEGEESSFASQENINVGEECIPCSASSEAEAQAEQVDQDDRDDQVSPTPTTVTTPTLGFISRIFSFVRKLLSNLTGFFK